ncbi:MAG: hypothetical protein ACO3L4_03485 [Candidatus Puniceispirillaceae bacterium]
MSRGDAERGIMAAIWFRGFMVIAEGAGLSGFCVGVDYLAGSVARRKGLCRRFA